jgi:aminoglycoside phosphotransferase (APT) family kinase protein
MSSPLFPRRFAGYPKLAGVPAIGLDLTQSQFLQLAPVLGGFLSFLHSFPVSIAAQVGVPEYPSEALIDDARVEALSDFHVVRHVGLDASEEELRALLETPVHARVSRTLVHCDLAAEHILLDPQTLQVTGIIDWGEISVGDPAIDIAGIFALGGLDFATAVLSHYQGEPDEGLLHRARFLAARKGIGDIVFGLEMHRQEYIDAGVRALRFCLAQQ